MDKCAHSHSETVSLCTSEQVTVIASVAFLRAIVKTYLDLHLRNRIFAAKTAFAVAVAFWIARAQCLAHTFQRNK